MDIYVLFNNLYSYVLSKYHLYTVVGTLVALVVNIPAGYALSRKELVGRKW